MHGMGGPHMDASSGLHGGAGIGGGRGGRQGRLMLTPAYVLISVSRVTDPEAFKTMMSHLPGELASFGGRLAADTDKPVSWDGTAPEHVVMIQFDSADQAQAWKNSDPFKSFDVELHRTSSATLQLVQGLPLHGGNDGSAGRAHMRLDQKAFEPLVRKNDERLTKMRGICSSC